MLWYVIDAIIIRRVIMTNALSPIDVMLTSMSPRGVRAAALSFKTIHIKPLQVLGACPSNLTMNA